MIHSQGQSAAGISFGRSELLVHPLAAWLQCGKAVAHLGDVDVHARCIAMINRSEDPDQALIDGLNLGTTGAPHLVKVYLHLKNVFRQC
ncbi:MAG: hypothetical protein VB142_03605 [Burkholderia sp.]